MSTECLRPSLLLAAFAATSLAATPPGRDAFLVISDLSGYTEPVGLQQHSPDLFFLQVGGHSIVRVTTKGATQLITTTPSGYNMGDTPITADNGRAYTSIAQRATINVVSLDPRPNSLRVYSPVILGIGYSQGLPDGSLFGAANSYSTGHFYVVTGTTDGQVTPIYEMPAEQQFEGSLVYASDGNYYGVAWINGGTGAGEAYIFKVTPAGAFTKLVDLPSNVFGTGFGGSFFQADDGNFYGTTPGGGGKDSHGTLYQVTPTGQYTLIHRFLKSQSGIPGYTFQASDGNFYGVTRGTSGPLTYGGIFRLTKSGAFTALHTLRGKDGACPCTLMQASDGLLYGTASGGGPVGSGTVFAYDLGLPKPAPQALSFHPDKGAAGTKVRIWGYNLLAAAVQFNGMAATDVSSAGPNYAWATVPTGATSGPITVTTPGGTSTTTASFTVK